MKHLNNELGKLRQEVKVGFIEVDNRFRGVNDQLAQITEHLQRTNQALGETQQQMGRIAKLVDDGFEVIQTYVSQQIDQQNSRLTSLEQRMDRAGL